MSARTILEALECTRGGCACHRAPRRGEGSTHCPAHDDREPSLSLTESSGKLLWHCHGGCTQEAVQAALSDRGLLHEVRDHRGRLVARHERKGRWIQPDGTIGLNGVSPKDLLYGLEQLASASPTKVVILTEGEKACDALRRLGFVALGTVTGASTLPSVEVLTHLQGRTVRLWPDNDPPGRNHMESIAHRLVDIAASISIVEWAGAPDKGDAADFIDAGAEREGVIELLKRATPWRGATPRLGAPDHLKVSKTNPRIWYLNFPEVGELPLKTEVLDSWPKVRRAYMEHFMAYPTCQYKPRQWEAVLPDLMANAEVIEVSEEFTTEGRILEFIRSFCAKPLPVREALIRGNVWLGDGKYAGFYVFKTLDLVKEYELDPFLRWHKGLTSSLVNEIIRERLGGDTRTIWVTRDKPVKAMLVPIDRLIEALPAEENQ